MIPDQPLSSNFGLYELTKTTYPQFQEKNRAIDDYFIGKLRLVASLLEVVRRILGVPLIVHSGYRCPDLNAFIGSKSTSQHPKAEAADFVPDGLDIDTAFDKIRDAARAGQIRFGQVILEKASRNYGVTQWIHISLSEPYRSKEKCGEVLVMNNGSYELLETI